MKSIMIMMARKSTIMAVQAVLEIHMERNMEHAMKPSMIRAGLVPTRLSIASAILEAKYCSSMLV